MLKRIVSGIMLTLFLTGMLSCICNIPLLTKAHSGDTFEAWATVTPSIDGVISPGEWDDAATAIFTLQTPESHEAILYVKNDMENLYMLFILRDEEYDQFPPEGGPCDYVSINFDNDHDGVRWTVGDDDMFIRGDGGYIYDGFYRTDGGWEPDTSDGGTDDMNGVVTHSNPSGLGDYTFEFSHALDSMDDAHDFSLEKGSTVGFQINYGDGASPGTYHDFWPSGSTADIVIAEPPSWVGAAIDINPDTINLKSKGKWNTAFIELPEGYNTSDIDVSTILLNGTIPVDPDAPTVIGDYDEDGIPDLMVKFDRAEVTSYILANVNMTKLYEERFMTITLTITGKLNDGTVFQGSDTIRIMMPMPRGGGRRSFLK